MDWGFVFQVTLAVLGAGLILGGIVAYRGSTTTGSRALSLAATAAGATMLVIVGMTISVSSTGGGPGPVIEAAGSAHGAGLSDTLAVGSAR